MPLTRGNEVPHTKIGGASGGNRLVEAAGQERHVI
jgi:hypothetical protein